VQKKQFQILLVFAIEITVLSFFCRKKSLGLLGVNPLKEPTACL